MEYTYETRKKLVEDYKRRWGLKLILTRKATRDHVREMEKISDYRDNPGRLYREAMEYYREGGYQTFSAMMKAFDSVLVDLYAGKQYREDFYFIIDKFNQFPYSRGVDRRTVRTKKYIPQASHVFELLNDYRVFQFYQCGVAEYLFDRLSEEKLDLKREGMTTFKMRHFDDIIAVRIDKGDKAVIQAVRELLLSDQNTAVLTVDVIRAIVKSSDESLHRLLADFLLAARLQEGVRQAVCENADCGTIQAFIRIFDTICENNLIRFSAVKRAIATWTGICDLEHVDRITEKITELMRNALKDPEAAREYLKTNDSIQISIGLWVLGFYEMQDAIDAMKAYLAGGTRNQLLTMSYYNRSLSWESFTAPAAKAVVKQFAGDEELLAAFMPTYLAQADQHVYQALNYNENRNRRVRQYRPISLSQFFDSEKEAREHYGIMRQILENMKEKRRDFYPCIFPWYGVRLSRNDLIKRMGLIAYALQDSDYMEEVAGKLKLIDTGEYYASRSLWVELLLHRPETEGQRALLLGYVADKEGSTRDVAFRMVKEMELEDSDYCVLEDFLKYKNSAIRRNVLELLGAQADEPLHRSVKRLLSSSKEEMRDGGLSLILAAREAGRGEACLGRLAEEAAELLKNGDSEKLSDKELILLREIVGADEMAGTVGEGKTGTAGEVEAGSAGDGVTGAVESGRSEAVTGSGTSMNRAAAVECDKAHGYGLYQPGQPFICPKAAGDGAVLREYFDVSSSELNRIVKKLIALIDEHAELEYKNGFGDEVLLGNGLVSTNYDSSLPFEDRYPFKEMWVDFYEKEIRDPRLLRILSHSASNEISVYGSTIKRKERLSRHRERLFGSAVAGFTLPEYQKGRGGQSGILGTVFLILLSIYEGEEEKRQARKAARELADVIVTEIPDEDLWYDLEQDKSTYYYGAREQSYALTDLPLIRSMIWLLSDWDTDEEFMENFYALYRLDRRFDYGGHGRGNNRGNGSSYGTWLSIYHYIKAYTLRKIPKALVFQAVFELTGLNPALEELSRLTMEDLSVYDRNCLRPFVPKEALEGEHFRSSDPFSETGRNIFTALTDRILETELKRGEMETEFSKAIFSIKRIYGMEWMVEILKAMGNDKLDRGTYYYWSGSSAGRRECLSHLLQVCQPREEDTAEKMERLLSGTKIGEQKLVETAMYAPQWLSVIEEYLGWPGLKSGCYYFMAHMNERFDRKKEAMIARYTPLTSEELNEGAFDLNWFRESYELLGEKRFSKLYTAAKYISDGSKHARARKYADAALGKVTTKQLEEQIREKRNKDLLMSYGLVPIGGQEDLLRRYEFIQQFIKESKQFGAQRRSSEAAAAATALKNMATAAGYADVTRLTLAMESELVKSYADYYEAHQLEDISLRLETDETGKTEMICEKAGKALKSVPAKFKKSELYLKLRDIRKAFNEQRIRAVKMFEQSMEEREVYRFGELRALCDSPVVGPVIQALVLLEEETKAKEENVLSAEVGGGGSLPVHGFLCGQGVRDCHGQIHILEDHCSVRVAHPFDLYKRGCWQDYQKTLFSGGEKQRVIKQPFKQIFRELYVKLPEELQRERSMMFAGNQIQPKKTAACLRGRRWVADYEEGLQKVYYRENLVARIYALADWFSPSDIEAPTLEWVEFTDRKTFQSVKLENIPDVVYSEVMRDVDLAVSVAHAGGVDPETSHSTVEMRKAILELCLPLFKLKNVRLEGSHALIEGTRGQYSIHLGSGVIHQSGGHQIQVLPVHSQGRGKMFLPFLDEDPKTAEIISKVVLFAEDQKMKDPYVLRQLN